MSRRLRVVQGPLALYAVGFLEELALLGYSKRAASEHLELLGDLSIWLQVESIAAAELTTSEMARFLDARRACGERKLFTGVGAGPLLGYLMGLGWASVWFFRPRVRNQSVPSRSCLSATGCTS